MTEAQKERKRASGRKYYWKNRDKCRAAVRRYGRTHHDERRDRIWQRRRELLNEEGCALCGYSNELALVFHHRDPKKKKFPVCGEALLRVWSDVLKERAKCDILCMNCHAIVHHEWELKKRKKGK